MQVLMLVGGKGTRLGARTQNVPKPLLEVGGVPFLDYLVQRAVAQQASDIVLLAGHFGDQVSDYASRCRTRGAPVRCLVEPEPAGTGGAIAHAQSMLQDTFLLLNGDSLFDLPLASLATIPAPENWIAKIALRPVEDGSRFGSVELNGSQVVQFAEKKATGPSLINGGVYMLRKSILSFIRGPCSIEADVFPVLVQDGLLFGCAYDSYFIDIGVPKDFQRAQREVPGRSSSANT